MLIVHFIIILASDRPFKKSSPSWKKMVCTVTWQELSLLSYYNPWTISKWYWWCPLNNWTSPITSSKTGTSPSDILPMTKDSNHFIRAWLLTSWKMVSQVLSFSSAWECVNKLTKNTKFQAKAASCPTLSAPVLVEF